MITVMDNEEDLNSPWTPTRAKYKKLPEFNPKTGEKIELYVCDRCGAVVASRKFHTNWHNSL